ncbi:hypothetical protein [Halobacillus campisalis]|uniref:Uncharacterized protein n=1 Tax=Halobacillus campisalis TaxID=435909 RepID=A0ABW2K9W1_9BACI|nr:hypothetical protein [Halobacillus campisalis]
MEKEKKTNYLLMGIGNLGNLLIGLAAMRLTSLLGDSTGYGLAFAGFLLVIIYQDYLEKKVGIQNKERYISRGILVIVFTVLAFVLYSPI